MIHWVPSNSMILIEICAVVFKLGVSVWIEGEHMCIIQGIEMRKGSHTGPLVHQFCCCVYICVPPENTLHFGLSEMLTGLGSIARASFWDKAEMWTGGCSSLCKINGPGTSDKASQDWNACWSVGLNSSYLWAEKSSWASRVGTGRDHPGNLLIASALLPEAWTSIQSISRFPSKSHRPVVQHIWLLPVNEDKYWTRRTSVWSSLIRSMVILNILSDQLYWLPV